MYACVRAYVSEWVFARVGGRARVEFIATTKPDTCDVRTLSFWGLELRVRS